MNKFADTIMVAPDAPQRPPALKTRQRTRPFRRPEDPIAIASRDQAKRDAATEHAFQAGFRQGYSQGRVGESMRAWLWGAATAALVTATFFIYHLPAA